MSYSKKLLELQRQFEGTKYSSLLIGYYSAYVNGNSKKMDEIIKKFPTEKQLFENLVNRLKGKSVFSNLKKILKGENVDRVDQEIALSSLYTHVCIECKKNLEYKVLKTDILNRIISLKKGDVYK